MFPFADRYRILLGSQSPRRAALLKGLDIQFDQVMIPGIDESYPADMPPAEVPGFLACKKSEAYLSRMEVDTLLITADTVVLKDNYILGKPRDEEDAARMLRSLSGSVHTVVTGVSVRTRDRFENFSAESRVRFSFLTNEEITYYLKHYRPYDKAGSYGIQEWIGFIGIEGIEGSFYNVMGLPIHRLYRVLLTF